MTIGLTPQKDYIRNAVLPVAEVAQDASGTLKVTRLRGTAFIISRNFALTARHVVSGASERLALLFTEEDQSWTAIFLQGSESHPSEDIAIVSVEPRADGNDWWSPFSLTADFFSLAQPYALWGYPEDIYHEVMSESQPWLRPDLVYYEGYIRRRLSDVPLSAIRGGQFYEVSTVAGGGCSGGPVVVKKFGAPDWRVFGIYVGERLSSDLDARSRRSVGYVARLEAVVGWAPDLLGGNLLSPGTPRIGPNLV